MKKIIYFVIAAMLLPGVASCDKVFDNLEGDLTKMSTEDLTGSKEGLDRLMASLYSYIPMGAYASGDNYTTESTETAGSTPMGPKGVSSFWNYTAVRDVNVFLQAIESAHDKGTISDNVYNSYKGEALFVRAYYYFAMVRTLGGVPIITEPLDEGFDGKENLGLYVQRSTEKETWDFVLSELDSAAELLPETRSTDPYRATKWSALGLKSRVALYAASVSRYWNRASIPSSFQAVAQKLTYMEESYAADYYRQCLDAADKVIKSGKFSLYQPTPDSVDDAVEALTNLFQSRQDCEWIFGKSYNDGVATSSNGFDLKNSPNQARGTDSRTWKFASYSVTSDFADACDYYDDSFGGVSGLIKTRTDGNESTYVTLPGTTGKTTIAGISYLGYDTPDGPFKKKDARFRAYVIYPESSFRNTTIKIQAGMWKSDGSLHIYDDSNPSETVDGVTYYSYGGSTESNFSAFYKKEDSNAGAWYSTCFGIRKFMNPTTPVVYSQTPWYDIRYAEVLLNYCEAAAELGTNTSEARTYLNQIRRRAAFLDTREPSLENVLHERRVELAFEDDYVMTMHRRRMFYNTARDQATNPTGGRRHTLLPIVDLHSGSPRYIFVRANYYADDVNVSAAGWSTEPRQYYSDITNYIKNKLVPNPGQE